MGHQVELQSQVRALAHQLAHGKISWADYRERRAETVRRIVRGEEPIKYETATLYGDPTSPKDSALDQVVIDLSEVEGGHSRWPAIIAVSALVAVVAVAGWVVYNLQQPPVTASAPVIERTPGESLLAGFHEAGDWSPGAAADLLDAWQALSAEARAEARTTATWRRLQNSLREQINQQAALAAVDESGLAEAEAERLRALRDALAEDQVSSS